jgi:hypothetical protein
MSPKIRCFVEHAQQWVERVIGPMAVRDALALSELDHVEPEDALGTAPELGGGHDRAADDELDDADDLADEDELDDGLDDELAADDAEITGDRPAASPVAVDGVPEMLAASDSQAHA